MKKQSITILLALLFSISSAPIVKADAWNGLWMNSDPENRTGFRKYETNYLFIDGDRARLTRTVGQHVAIHEETFFVKGSTTCKLGQVEMICQVSENELKLCKDAWNCDQFVKTTKSIPSAPEIIQERPTKLLFTVTAEVGSDILTFQIPISDILPSDTNYPRKPFRIPFFLHDVAAAEAWVEVYWIDGKSTSLSSYMIEIQIMQLNGPENISKIVKMEAPRRLSSFFNTQLQGTFLNVDFKADFRVR